MEQRAQLIGTIVAILSLIITVAAWQCPECRFWQPDNQTATQTSEPEALQFDTDPITIETTPVPSQNFTFETTVAFDASENYEGAGIIAILPDGGQINYVLAYCDSDNCINRGLYIDALETESFENNIFRDYISYADDVVDLRLIAEDNGNITADYRPSSSESWQQFATFSIDVPIESIGFVAQTSLTGVNVENISSKTATFINYALTSR